MSGALIAYSPGTAKIAISTVAEANYSRIFRSGTYCMVLVRKETCVWLMNHDVSILLA